MQCAASSTKDSDKISCNAARAIGNLLRYMPSGCFQQPDMEKAVELAVRGLVKNMSSGTMKVRDWQEAEKKILFFFFFVVYKDKM